MRRQEVLKSAAAASIVAVLPALAKSERYTVARYVADTEAARFPFVLSPGNAALIAFPYRGQVDWPAYRAAKTKAHYGHDAC